MTSHSSDDVRSHGRTQRRADVLRIERGFEAVVSDHHTADEGADQRTAGEDVYFLSTFRGDMQSW